MNREQFIAHLDQTYAEAAAIVKLKNQDYGADANPFKNFEFSAQIVGCPAETGIMVRFSDKVARIGNLLNGKDPAVKEESIDDTILDAINYLAILRAWRVHMAEQREQQKLVGLTPEGKPVFTGQLRYEAVQPKLFDPRVPDQHD